MRRLLVIISLLIITTTYLYTNPILQIKAEDTNNDKYSIIWSINLSGYIPGPVLVSDIDNDEVDEIVGAINLEKDENNFDHGYLFIADPLQRKIEWESNDIGALPYRSTTLKVVDLQNDGKKEIIAYGRRKGAYGYGPQEGYLYILDGESHELIWQSENIGAKHNPALDIKDLNGDGFKELIAGSAYYYGFGRFDGSIYVFNGFNFSLLWKSRNIGEIKSIITDDIDDDGVYEIIVGTCTDDTDRFYDGYVHIFDGETFDEEWRSEDLGVCFTLAVDDIDNDGVKELIVGTNWQRWYSDVGHIYIFDGISRNLKWKSPNLKYPYVTKIMDVDSDYAKEIIVGTGEWHQQEYNGHLQIFDGATYEMEFDSIIGNVRAIIAADVDNDNGIEVITASSFEEEPFTGYLRIFDALTKELEWISDNINPYSLTVADIDGNGQTDIIALTAQDGSCSVRVISCQKIPDYNGLIKKYFPYIIFDEEEKYFPTNFYYDDSDIDNNPSKYDKNTWPICVYVHVVEGRWKDWGSWEDYGKYKDWIVIEYWFYYVRDNKLWDIPILGAHDHDWESVYVFLEKKEPEPEPRYVIYFHHYGGVWWIPDKQDSYDRVNWKVPGCPACECEKVNETHPVVHIARDSHASYPWTIGGWSKPLQRVMVPVPSPEPPGWEIIELPYPEPCDGGQELDYDDFQIIIVDEPDPEWPTMFGEIPAPWADVRRRWNDPGYLLRVVVKLSLSIKAYSPVNLLVTAPNGLRTGYDQENGLVINEIVYAIYSGPDSDPQVIIIPDPLPGAYNIQAYGIDSGPYTITVETKNFQDLIIDNQTLAGFAEPRGQYKKMVSITSTGKIFTWEYIFEDVKRGTILRISTDDKHFQFITPDKEFSIKEANKMLVYKHLIFIWHKDNEIRLVTVSIDTKIDFCFAFAKDMETGKKYMLIDKPGTES